MKRTRTIYLVAVALIGVVSFCVWFFSTGFTFQPSRLKNPSGWQETNAGGGIIFVGQFVLSKGESTDNGKFGVKLLNITSKPCPFATICLAPEAKATLRFYRPSDQSVICEPTLESSSTSYVTKVVCPGLPFTNLDVREINTRQNWALISFFNLDESQRTK